MAECDCSTSTSWATTDDLYDRFGDEYVDKLATRRNWNEASEMYVADENDEAKEKVLCLALCDAKSLLLQKLQCKFADVSPLETANFPGIKQLHIKLTIQTLKAGGDCSGCECNEEIDKYIACGTICTDDGICLVSSQTFISATEAHFKCECQGHCGCC